MIRIRFVSLFFVTIMIMGSLQSLTMFNIRNSEVTTNSELSSVDIIGLLPDPDFDSAPEFVINGSSSEFMVEHFDATGEGDKYVELVWNHIANTTLDFTSQDPYQILPDCNDFVYVYQEFDWPYNMKPNDAEVHLRFGTFRTGDFAEGVQENNNLMFRVFVWAIDSSENWIKIYETRDAIYTEAYQTRIAELNFFTLSDIFDGMVTQGGIQEDPSDTVKLAIGLAPTIRFENYLATEPWTFYNGSVSINITSCDFFAQVEIEDNPDSIWQPVYNVTYGTIFGDIFPMHPNASDDVRDSCYGMVAGDDGSIYVTGNTISSYELYISEGLRFRNQFLLKYDPSLNLQWAVRNDNGTQVRAITFHDGYIFTTGYCDSDEDGRNLIVTKWSAAGVKVWEEEWGEEYSQVGVGVAVQENGSIYVIASDYDMENFPGYMNTSVLKFDTDGSFVWKNHQMYLPLIWDIGGDLYIQGEYLYFANTNLVYVLNLEGDIITGMPAAASIPDGNNGFFSAIRDTIQGVEDSSQVIVYHLNETGHQSWNATYIHQWPNGKYSLYIPIRMAMTHQDTVLVLLFRYTIDYEFILVTYDFDGNLLNNRTILNDAEDSLVGGSIYMVVGTGGLCYFAFDILEGETDINIQAYRLYQESGWFPLSIPVIIMITSAAVIVGAVASIARWKRRNS